MIVDGVDLSSAPPEFRAALDADDPEGKVFRWMKFVRQSATRSGAAAIRRVNRRREWAVSMVGMMRRVGDLPEGVDDPDELEDGLVKAVACMLRDIMAADVLEVGIYRTDRLTAEWVERIQWCYEEPLMMPVGKVAERNEV